MDLEVLGFTIIFYVRLLKLKSGASTVKTAPIERHAKSGRIMPEAIKMTERGLYKTCDSKEDTRTEDRYIIVKRRSNVEIKLHILLV